MVYNDSDPEDEGKGEEHPELAPDGDGQVKWRMEFNTPGGVAPSVGIPQSQIMDTGTFICMHVYSIVSWWSLPLGK